MLNLLNQQSVPGVDNVTLYADDENPHKFYMMPNLPMIKRGPDGKLLFSLVVMARDFYLFKNNAADLQSQETEAGLLNLSTALLVPDDAQQKIRTYLAGQQRIALPIFRAGRVGLQWRSGGVDPSTIILAYPDWVEPAKVTFALVPAAGDTFVKAATGSDKPSLTGENLATYQALLGQEGVELLRQGLEKGFTMANVAYQVSFVARLPAIHIEVTGDAKRVYDEIKQHCQVTETYSNGSVWSYPAVSGLQEMQTTFTQIRIKVDDGDFTTAGTADPAAAADTKKTISDFVFGIVSDYLKNTFFAPPFTPGVQPDKLGTDPLTHNPWKDPNAQPTQPNQLWLKNFEQSMQGNFGFVADYRKNLTVSKYPNAMLTTLAKPAEVTGCIVEADLSNPYFQILDVTVNVTADFDNDPIAAILVTCAYEQTDEATGQKRSHTDQFKFETGKETFRFQTLMAKAKDGTPKDGYVYSTKIIYKFSAEPVTTPNVAASDRHLVLGYNQMHCVRVLTIWGAVPNDTVSRIQVHFEYPDATLAIASKSKDVFLTPDHPTDSWFTYTGGNTSLEYTYTVTYFLVSGQTLTLPLQRSTQASLVLNAPFEDTLSVTFVPQGQFPPTQQIVVSTRYTDSGDGYSQSDVHSFGSLTDTWKWQVRLHDRTQRAYQYKVDTTFNDGSSDVGVWKDGTEGTVLVGQVAQKILEVDVVTTLLDFASVWKLVIVKLSYADPDHGVDQDQTFELTAANASGPLAWRVPIKDASRKTYTYQVDAYGFQGQTKTLGPTQSTSTALVLQL